MSWRAYFIAWVITGAVNAALVSLLPDRPAPPMPQKPPSPHQLIVGDWRDVGDPNRILCITSTETIFIVHGKVQEGDGLTATHTIDWTANPFKIGLQPRTDKGRFIPGVFTLEGDTLKLGLRTFNPGPDKVGPLDFSNADLRIDYQRAKQ